jgi:polyphosphate kinase
MSDKSEKSDKKKDANSASGAKIHVKEIPAPERYLNRELAWVEFNARVLEEGQDETTPLLERVKFLAILAKNLDEFAEVRVPRLKKAMGTDDAVEADGFRPHEVLARSDKRIREIEAQANALWETLVPKLAAKGIRVLAPGEWTADQRRAVDEAFGKARSLLLVKPCEAGQPFPLVRNGQLFLALATPGALALTHLVIVNGEPNRLVKLPAPDGQLHFAKLEDAIRANLDKLVPGAQGDNAFLMRLTRDTNFLLNEEGEAELVRSISEATHNDAEDMPVRLQYEGRAACAVVIETARRIGVDLSDLFNWGSFADHRGLFGIAGLDLPALHDPVQPALQHPTIAASKDMFEAISKEDILLFHPYHSYDPVVRLVQEASKDPAVRAIHMTLYRTSSSSPIVAALGDAAKAGKNVHVLVEAKARFDEEANVARAKALEAAGAKVSLGLKGLKTHGKGLMVEREEGGKTKRYIHLATGNYNEKSAKIYGDLSLFTCDEETTGELAAVFAWLEGGPKPPEKRKRIWNAPDFLRAKLEALIANEIEHAKAGHPARIIAKMNAIADRKIIESLYAAADAGVQVDLIIRGACTLRPGSGKVASRLTARRIVDRYLEHARVLYFQDGAPEHGKADIFLSSADWMGRNLDKRVELLFKIKGDNIQRIKEYLDLQLEDDVKARRIERDGSSTRFAPPPGRVRCQQVIYDRLARAGRP